MKKCRLFFILLAMGLSVVSCGSDDSDSENVGNPSGDLIIGNWSYIGDIDEDGYEASEHEPCDDEFLKFNSDGTAVTTLNYCGEETEIINGSWQKAPEADKYIFIDGTATAAAKVVFSQNNSRMTIYGYEDQFYGIVYQRQ